MCFLHPAAGAPQRGRRESGDSGGDDSADDAELARASVWLSATVEAEALSGAGADALLDWRIVIAAPLALDNQLPLRGSLLVWERPKARPTCRFAGVSKPDLQDL